MTRTRRAIPLALALAVVAAACGDSDDAGVAATDSTTAAPSATDTTDAGDGAEQGDAGDGAEGTGSGGDGGAAFAEVGTPEAPLSSSFSDPVSALRTRDDSSFPEPAVDLARILSGGPPPDGIPPVDAPVYAPIADIGFLEDTDPVLVLEIDGDARAYPVEIMTWHEIVNTEVGGIPVTVSYCPLCNSAVAYDRREADGTLLDFGTSGSLFNSSLVMYDRQTESLWTHFDGRAVVGVMTGAQLRLIPLSLTSWADFTTAHPDGQVLTRDTGFSRQYGRNPYPGYDDINTNPFLFDGELDGQLPAKQRVVGVRGDESVAIVRDFLAAEQVVPFTLDGADLVAFHVGGTSSALDGGDVGNGADIGASGVFDPVVDGQALTFTGDDGTFIDAETASTWNIFGEAIDGPLAGNRLTPIERVDTFWFALAAFQPQTRIIDG